MNTITRGFTKEQLIARANHLLCVGKAFLAEHPEYDGMAKDVELFGIALASLEAEAVAYVDPFAFNNFSVYRAGDTDNNRMGREWMWANPGAGLIPVYTAPPAPTSVPAAYEHTEDFSEYHEGWNACRAAMLQGAEQPQNAQQNIPENIPATQFKPVADLYGLTSPTGGETSFTFDAFEARDFIDGGWSCRGYVELERFQEAASGNSPVIPDGWVMLPSEPTQAMMNAWLSEVANWRGHAAGYRAMIAAAPQQEA